VSQQLLPLRASSYQPHDLHANDRIWTETNCYVDVWIEVLHALGLDPLAAASFAVGCDFEGDQWTFFKYPPEDLWNTYGIDVHEMNVWRPVIDHVTEQLGHGRLLTVEVNSFFLPDTHGVAYRREHVKTTIVANHVDPEARRLGYFHNAGYFELEGDDFDGVFRLGAHTDPNALPPYVELVRLDRLRRDPVSELAPIARRQLRSQLHRRPTDNPIARLATRVHHDLEWLATSTPEDFHEWAFGTVRQCGASAELAAAFCTWLAQADATEPAPIDAAARWTSLAETAKSLQFLLARAARGRTVDLSGAFSSMADDWQAAQALLDPRVPS
jgi:hypothetical protein